MNFRSKISLILSFLLVVSFLNLGISVARSDFSYAGLVGQVSFESISDYVKTLSSDEFRGRMEGDKGITLARDYIANQFSQMGLTPAGDDGTYLQHYNVPLWYPEAPLRFDIFDSNDKKPFEMVFREDYKICLVSGSGKATNVPLVFAGFGISVKTDYLEYDDYKDVDVDGKIAVIFRHAPMFIQEMFEEHEELYSVMYYNTKITNAFKRGAVGVVLMENPKLERKSNISIKSAVGYDAQIPCLFMSDEGSTKLLSGFNYTPESLFDKIDEKKAPNSFTMRGYKANLDVNIRVESNVDTSNVIGYIPASDPFGANQTVMITAHYDHLGIDPTGEIYNGAADNASGVAAVLEVARVLSRSSVRSNINIAFVAFSGEEIGLLGSTHMANNPPFPLEGMTVLNMDMVAGNQNMVNFGYDESHTRLTGIFKNSCAVLGVDYNYFKARNNSDHGPFAQLGVPAVFILGRGPQMYHVPEDTFENVSIEGIELVTRVVTHIVAKMSDPFYLYVSGQEEEKILASNPEFELTGYTGRGAMVYVGGRSTIASESGRFKLNLSLSDGDNVVRVVSNQVGTGYKLEKTLTINFEPRPMVMVSKDMLNFGYVSKEAGSKSITFEVKNVGDGPIEGTVSSCADWMTITPDKLEPQETLVTASVDISKVTDLGLNTCVLSIETTGGIAFVPVTVVSSNSPVIEIEMTPENDSVVIAGSTRSIKNKLIRNDEGFLYPSSVISMAYGLDVSSNGNQKILSIGDKTVRLWLGSDVAVIGHRPFQLSSNVIESADGEVYVPEELISELDILVSVDEKTHVHKLIWNTEKLKLGISEVEVNQSYKIESNMDAVCNVSVDSDWLVCYPHTINTAESDSITVWIDESKIVPDTRYSANIIVKSGDVQTEIPVNHFVASSKKIIEVQIDSTDAKVNGTDFKLENPPFIHIDTTMVPFRFIGEAFGAEIKWEADTRTVIAVLGKTLVEIQIDNLEGKINGSKTKLVRAPMIVEGRTFVPFRFIGEAFGADVEWIPDIKGVKVVLDDSKGIQKPILDKPSIELEWIDATESGLPPWEEVKLDGGSGNLVIKDYELIGENIKAEKVSNTSVKVTLIYTEDGFDGKNYVLMNTNSGVSICVVDIKIYPKDRIEFTADSTKTWFINGQIQTDKQLRIDGLVATNSDKVISAASGSYGFDSIGKELSIYSQGKNLRLNVESGDFWLDGELVDWKFDYQIINESDVYLPWPVYSLAFGWEIIESVDGKTISMVAKKEEDSFLITNKKSLDLIYSESVFSYKMNDFSCPIYPLKSGNVYNSSDDSGDYKLYLFFDTSDESSAVIPFVESIHSRYADKGLKSYLVSAEIPTDSHVETFFTGNRILKEGLSNISLTSVTTPILFDTTGQVCSEFPGAEFPRVYVTNGDNKLVFWLPQFTDEKFLYLEQALVRIIDGSGFVPPDVELLTISNSGGKAGGGRVTSSSSEVMVLGGEFSESPANVAVSFNPEKIQWEKNFKSFEIALLGNSNSVQIPVRCWNIGVDKTLTSFHDGLSEVKIDGITKPLPEKCTSGDDPYGPIGLILESIGADIVFTSSTSVRVVSGENDVSFDLGTNFVTDSGKKSSYSKNFDIIGGFLYGPVKFLAEFSGATVMQFDNATVITAKKVKGNVSKPVLKVDSSKIQVNDYIDRFGGYRPAPNFNLRNYPLSDGGKTELEEVLSRDDVELVLIDLWATWCPPCKYGMPYVERLHRLYGDKGLYVMGIITDAEGITDDDILDTLESDHRIQNNLEKLGLDKISYPMVYDDKPEKTAQIAYEAKSIPRMILINKDMQWVHTEVGFWEQGIRNLEYKIRRILGIEEKAKMPVVNISNGGVGVLEGSVSCDLSYLKPTIEKFETGKDISFTFEIQFGTPLVPERGLVTIESNGGKRLIPIEYNPFRENNAIKVLINTDDGSVVFNDRETSVIIESRFDGSIVLVDAVSLLSMLGGELSVLPDRRRSIGTFELWDISFTAGETEIHAGLEKFKATKPVQIEGSKVFVEFEILCEIIGAYCEPKKAKDQIYMEYTP